MVAGRSDLPRTRWRRAGFTHVYTLADYTEADTAHNPALTARLLTRIGTTIAHHHLTEHDTGIGLARCE